MTGFQYYVRLNRLIAAIRGLLAAVAYIAIYLDPSPPAGFARLAYPLLVGYALISFLVWVLAARARRSYLLLSLGAHLIDLAAFTALVVFTEGLASPFFAFFVFSLLSATMYWHARGAYATGAYALLVLLVLATADPRLAPGVPFQTDFLLVRIAYVIVFAVMFVHFGAHHRRQLDEISGLLAPDEDTSHETPAARCLARVCAVFGTNRAMLAFSDPNEPWITLAVLTGEGYKESREPPTLAEPDGLAPPVAFSTSDAADPSSPVLTRDKSSCQLSLKLPDALVGRLAIRSALAAPVRGQLTDGVLILPDLARATSDDLLLGEILGIYCATSLDRMLLAEEMARAAAAGERVELARDLHDSVLQSITGARLRIETMMHAPSDTEMRSQLAALSEALALEYVSLRSYIAALSPKESAMRSGAIDLSSGITELLRPLSAQWGIKLRVVPPQAGTAVSPAVFRQLSLLLNETVSNAARHGGATIVSVDMTADQRNITISIADNGKGFRPYGRYAHEQLIEKSIGSESLRRRVAALSGAMSMSSSASGVVISVVIPYPSLFAAHAD